MSSIYIYCMYVIYLCMSFISNVFQCRCRTSECPNKKKVIKNFKIIAILSKVRFSKF